MKTSLVIPDEMSEKLSRISEETGLTKSEIIRTSVQESLSTRWSSELGE